MSAHPFLELGEEFKQEVGCIHCLRVGTREAWERGGWSCPYDDCNGTAFDVYPPEHVVVLRGKESS